MMMVNWAIMKIIPIYATAITLIIETNLIILTKGKIIYEAQFNLIVSVQYYEYNIIIVIYYL